MQETKTINIVGAGPGGLASAILLASSGLRVRVFERQNEVGGRTSTLQAQGFQFDLGPTFFLYPRILDEIFAAAGTRLNQELEMVRLDPQYRICFGSGGKLDATAHVERMEKEIASLSPKDASGFSRFMTENREKMKFLEPCLETPYLGWKDLFRKHLFRALPWIRPTQSVESYLKRFFEDPRVRLAFCFQSKYLGMSPFRCPSLFSILSFLEYEHGVWHPIGGCGAITKTMQRLAEGMGVEFHLGSPVDSLEFKGRRVTAVVSKGQKYAADATVINADFARAMHRLIPSELRPSWSNRKISKSQFSCSTYMLYLGIRGAVDLPHHTIHIAEAYEENLRDIEDRHRVSEDPSFYVQNASVTDPTLAPSGHSGLYVLAPVPHESPGLDWSVEAPRLRKRLFERLREKGIKDLEQRIVFEHRVTPADWNAKYEIHLGATFNLAHTLDQMLHLRPQNRFPDLERMYLVGGGTHPGSGLPVIFESARISSRLLMEDLGWVNAFNPAASAESSVRKPQWQPACTM